MHARTSLKAHRPVSGVARSTAAAHCIVLLHAIHSSRVVAAAHTRSAALLRPWEDSSLGWWPRPRSGTERVGGAPVGLLRACSTTKCKYKVHSSNYKMHSAKYKVQSAKYKVQRAPVGCARACSTSTKYQSDVNRPRPILELSDKIFPRPTKDVSPFPGQFEIEA